MELHSTPAGFATPTRPVAYRPATACEELSRRAANAIDAYLWVTSQVRANRLALATR